tara:strand:+ start:390 stop:560 length:171 start_codon:yes stop_codon:yes gene_type:complete
MKEGDHRLVALRASIWTLATFNGQQTALAKTTIPSSGHPLALGIRQIHITALAKGD